jgi:hypothetical protein
MDSFWSLRAGRRARAGNEQRGLTAEGGSVGKGMDRKKETKKPSKKEKEKAAKKLAAKQPGSTIVRPG